MDSDTALPYSVRRAVGEALAASPGVVAALVEWAQQPPVGLAGGPQAAGAQGAGQGATGTNKVDLYSLQVRLVCGKEHIVEH